MVVPTIATVSERKLKSELAEGTNVCWNVSFQLGCAKNAATI